MKPPTRIRIFLSSPGDVKMERETARRVVERLQGEIGGHVRLEPYFWEHEVMVATKDYQENIPSMDGFDIVVCVLWSRLGTPLNPERHPRPGGGYFESGTEYEFFTAREAHKHRGAPDIFVFRNGTEPRRPSRPREAREAVDREVDRLDQFFERYFREDEYFTAAVNEYRTLGEFEEKLTLALRSFLEGRVPRDPSRLRQKPQYDGQPYLGLAAFDFKDAPVFFGRTAQIGGVVEAFQTQELDARATGGEGSRFVLVLGASGSGKSSLARAGVLPMLVQPGVVEGAQAWRRAVFKPADAGGDPFLALATALLEPDALPELASDGTTAEDLAGLMRRQQAGAGLLLRQALSQAGLQARVDEEKRLTGMLRRMEEEQREEDARIMRERIAALTPPAVRLALLADQMEELFTADLAADVAAGFIDVLHAMATSGRVFVLATLRSDFYPNCLDHPKLVELMRGNGSYALPAPGPGDLGQMIRQPAAAAGLIFEENRATGEKLDDLLRDAALKDPAALPLLSYTLEQLHERRTPDGVLTLAAYHELGGLEGAIGSRAEAVFSALPGDAQAAFDGVWRQLVTLCENGEPVRRRTPRGALTTSEGAAHLVEKLIAARLLTADQAADGARTVSVAHEALLRHWPRVVRWVEENRDFLRTRSRLAARLAEWTDHQESADYLIPRGPALAEAEGMLARHASALETREAEFIRKSSARAQAREQARLRRARLVTMGAVILSLVAVAGGAAAWRESRTADRERAAAVEQKTAAEASAAASLASETRAAYLLGAEMLDAGKSREGLTSLAQALMLNPHHEGARDRLYSYHLYGLPKAIPIRSVAAPEGARQRISGANRGSIQRVGYMTLTKGMEAFDLTTRKVIPGPWENEPDSVASGILFSSRHAFNLRKDNTIRIWEMETGQASEPITISKDFSHLSFTDDGRWILEGTVEGDVRLHSVREPETSHTWKQSGKIVNASPNPESEVIVVAGGELVFFNLQTGKRITSLTAKGWLPMDARFSADGNTVVVSWTPETNPGGRSSLGFYEAATGKTIQSRVIAFDSHIIEYEVNHDGTEVVIAALGEKPMLRHRNDETKDIDFPYGTYPVKIRYSRDERLVFAADTEGTVKIFDRNSRRLAFEPISHDARLEDLSVTWDGRYLLTSTATHARVWDLSVGRALTLPIGQQGACLSAAFAENGKALWIASTKGLLKWDTAMLEIVGDALFYGEGLYDAHFDAAGTRVAALLEGHRVALADLSQTPPATAIWQAPAEPGWLAIARDGSRVAISINTEILLLDPLAGEPVGEPWKLPHTVTGVAFSGDSRSLLALTEKGVHLLDPATRGGRELKLAGNLPINRHASSPDGRWFATCYHGTTMATAQGVLVWDLQAPEKEPRVLPCPEHPLSLTFSADGTLIAAGGRDQTVRVWSTGTGEPACQPLLIPADTVNHLAFSPDNRLLATICGETMVRVWDWREGRPVSEYFPLGVEGEMTTFTPDGRGFLACSTSRSGSESSTLAAIWEVSPPDDHPVDLLALTEATTALRVTPGNLPEACDPFASWERIRTATPDSWFLRDPMQRPISPASAATTTRWLLGETTGVNELTLSMPSVGVVRAAVGYWRLGETMKLRGQLERLKPDSREAADIREKIALIEAEIPGLIQTAERLAPGDGWVNYFLGRHASLAGDNHKALDYTERALAIEPDSTPFIAFARDLHGTLGNLDEKEKLLLRLRQLQPDSTEHRLKLGQHYWDTNRRGLAREEIRPTLDDPRLPPYERALVFLMLERPQEALEIFKDLARTQKADSEDQAYNIDSLFLLIIGHQQCGEIDTAIGYYRELAAITPDALRTSAVAALGLPDYLEESLRLTLEACLKKHPELAPPPPETEIEAASGE